MPNESSVADPGGQAGAVTADSAGPPVQPVLSVLHGEPTEAELAAVITVLAARSRAAAESAGRPAPARASRSTWSAKSRLLRVHMTPGPGGWRRSALPS
jgi:acyl-CoA carboxylase epsilon subunit